MATDMNMFVYVATLDPKCRSEGMKAVLSLRTAHRLVCYTDWLSNGC